MGGLFRQQRSGRCILQTMLTEPDEIAGQSIIKLSPYGSKNYASLILCDSKVNGRREKENAVFVHPYIVLWLCSELQNRRHKLGIILVFKNSRGILSKLAAFIFF